jgi:hypothetical protein
MLNIHGRLLVVNMKGTWLQKSFEMIQLIDQVSSPTRYDKSFEDFLFFQANCITALVLAINYTVAPVFQSLHICL